MNMDRFMKVILIVEAIGIISACWYGVKEKQYIEAIFMMSLVTYLHLMRKGLRN